MQLLETATSGQPSDVDDDQQEKTATNKERLGNAAQQLTLVKYSLEAISSCVVGCALNEDLFLERGGVFLLLDLLEVSPNYIFQNYASGLAKPKKISLFSTLLSTSRKLFFKHAEFILLK